VVLCIIAMWLRARLLCGRRRRIARQLCLVAPEPGTRRWARAMFAQGLISIEELNAYCQTHHTEG